MVDVERKGSAGALEPAVVHCLLTVQLKERRELMTQTKKPILTLHFSQSHHTDKRLILTGAATLSCKTMINSS